jgi:hypothetical protein
MMRVRLAQRPGQSIVMFAVLLSAFLGMMALGTDLLIMYVERRAAQGVADLAALSAAPLSMSGSPSLAESQARATATANGYTNGTGGVVIQISYPAASQMRVRITKDVPTIFAITLGQSTTTVLGQATASQNVMTNMAIFGNSAATSNPNKNTVDLTGGAGGATINGTIFSQCELRIGSNFTVSSSIMYNGSNTDCGVPDNRTNPSVSDYPVGARSYPISASMALLSSYPCDYDRRGQLTSTTVSGLGRKPYANELPNTGPSASRHDGDWNLSDAGAWWYNTNTLQSGVYCIRDGDLKWTGTPACPCSGTVTFVLAGASSKVDPFNPSNFTLTPYTFISPDTTGMMIFNAESTQAKAVSIGGSGGSFAGYIYAPGSGATVDLAGSGTRSLTGAIYADLVNLTGGAWTLTGTGTAPNFFTSSLAE